LDSFAVIQGLLSRQHFQQGRFSCPVPANESKPLAFIQQEIGAIQQRMRAKGQLCVF